jgi:4a-hydroxytetrahydrobiopterin dehydratase
MSLLSNSEITKELVKLKGWSIEGKQITKQFELKDFKSALSFVNKVGEKAEEMDHHPDIFIHSWNKVKITISTHSEGGITKKDFQLAEKIEGIK